MFSRSIPERWRGPLAAERLQALRAAAKKACESLEAALEDRGPVDWPYVGTLACGVFGGFVVTLFVLMTLHN